MTSFNPNRSIYPAFQTLPTGLLEQIAQQDRWPNHSEFKAFSDFFSSGAKRLQVAETLGQEAQNIVAAAARRIFYGGSVMAYLEPLPNREQMPGYSPPPRFKPAKSRVAEPLKSQKSQLIDFENPLRRVWEVLQNQLSPDRQPLPNGFKPIHVKRYGVARMRRSMRDLDWFLRYVIYAIAAGDASIITVNTHGLRGVIPEDVTEATIAAIQEMNWRAVQLFKQDPEAVALIQEPFDAMLTAYRAEKPLNHLRPGISADQQGLKLPDSYPTARRLHFVMHPALAETEKQTVIRAVYRQVFERDITREYGLALSDLESRFRSSEFSTREFVRQLGLSRLYRDLFYAPASISRVIEQAVRHFLGRSLYSLSEFQTYFELISTDGLPGLVNQLVNSQEYADWFGEQTVPYLRDLGQEAQACRNWTTQRDLLRFSSVQQGPRFITQPQPQRPAPNQHIYGAGHDCLEIQFGAIFPERSQTEQFRGPGLSPAPDQRRILISCAVNAEAGQWGKTPGSLEDRIVRASRPAAAGLSVNLSQHSAEAVLEATYRQVFGRTVLAGQRLTHLDSKLSSGEITLREFVRQLAKSPLFRSLYWDSLYVTKAIEYIHRRLLGRPTASRIEMSHYYDICAKQGFYALVDALIDSPEYVHAFQEDIVPYERAITPRGYELRLRHHPPGSDCPMPGARVAEGHWVQEALRRNSYVTVNGSGLHSELNRHAPTNGKTNQPSPVEAAETQEPAVLMDDSPLETSEPALAETAG
jgi:phycobilisome core-membrane linker protein